MAVDPNWSPFWLQLYGKWIDLPKIQVDVEIETDRPSNELVTMDGVRWVQQAPVGPRTWTLNVKGDPGLVAALRVAIDAPTVLLYSEDAAAANMLDPDDCYGTGDTTLACGLLSLPALDLATTAKTIAVPVRSGVPLRFSAWTTNTGTLGSITYPGGTATLTGASGRIAAAFTPNADGTAVITLTAAAGRVISGLMLSTATAAPASFVPGEGTPCQVSVGDPTKTLNAVSPTAGTLPTATYSFPVKEVG